LQNYENKRLDIFEDVFYDMIMLNDKKPILQNYFKEHLK